MKKNNLLIIVLFVSALFTSSCSSDDNNNNNSDAENMDTAAISLANLSSGVMITGAKKETGTPPAPNGILDFQTSTENQVAFLKSGLNISFTSTDQVAGAYIQLKDSEGNNVDEYFNVPAAAFGLEDDIKSAYNQSKKKSTVALKSNKEEEEIFINLDFENAIPVGTFCYAICVYDDNGNISQVEGVCVDVQAWGGNTSIVGEWVYQETDLEVDNTTDIFCSNQEVLDNISTATFTKDEWILVINEDGTYYELYNTEGTALNYEETQETCIAVYQEENDQDKYSGNWSYTEETKTFTFIDFKYEDLLDSTQNEDYPDGSVYFDNAKIEIVAGKLVITETSVEGNDITNLVSTFTKK